MTYQFDDAWPSLHIDGSGEDDGSPGYEWLSPDGAAHWQPDETRPCATCGRAARPRPCECNGGPECPGCPDTTPAVTMCPHEDCQYRDVWPCPWLIARGRDEDGSPVITECGARARPTDTGWRCEAGHEHVEAEARSAQGWDYAADEGEAAGIACAGVEPRDMSGRRWL